MLLDLCVEKYTYPCLLFDSVPMNSGSVHGLTRGLVRVILIGKKGTSLYPPSVKKILKKH